MRRNVVDKNYWVSFFGVSKFFNTYICSPSHDELNEPHTEGHSRSNDLSGVYKCFYLL